MKIYLVLEYYEEKDTFPGKSFGISKCTVDRVYRHRSQAEKRAALLSTRFRCYTYHVIEKTLKGKP